MPTRRIILACILATIICTPVLSCITSTSSNSKPGTYDITWSGCDLNNTLSSAYSTLGIKSIALYNGNSSDHQKTFKHITYSDFMYKLAGEFSLGQHVYGDLYAFGPQNCTYIYSIMQNTNKDVANKFALSLTPSQLDIHKAKDGIPWNDLSKEQKAYIRYCVTTQHTNYIDNYYYKLFPEPELTNKIEQSKVILAIQPVVSVDYYNEKDKTVTGSSYHPYDITFAEYEKGWKQELAERNKMAENTYQLTGGFYAQGDSGSCQLQGIYTISELIGKIQDNYKGTISSITIDNDTGNLQVSAYCSTSYSYLADALATVTGMDWMRKGNTWMLAVSPQRRIILDTFGIDAFSNKAFQDSMRLDESTSLKLREMMKTNKLKVIANPHWTYVNRMLSYNAITPNDLTNNQRRELIEYIDKHWKYSHSLSDSPDYYGLQWSPMLRLYVSTDNTLLASQGLNTFLPYTKSWPKASQWPKIKH